MDNNSDHAEIGSLKIRVELHLTATEAGGRRNPVFDGYRSPWDIGLGHAIVEGREVPALADGVLHLIDCETVAPGTSATADVTPLSSAHWRHVDPGSRIALMEGTQRIGEATVISVREHD